MPPDIISQFENQLENVLIHLIPEEPSSARYGLKIIHDAIWGTSDIFPWEIAILDTPLLQKLRYIRQTGLAYLVYPSATHTRFDHSLGVLAAASLVFNRLHRRGDLGYLSQDDAAKPTQREVYATYIQLRLAALLHDCGHSFLSHASELIYSKLDPFPDVIKAFNRREHVESGASEILSYFIIRSTRLRNYILRIRLQDERVIPVDFRAAEIAELLNGAAEFVIGKSSDHRKVFCANIINGPYDADKLDYIKRDGYYAGITVNYDLDRLLYQVSVEAVDVHKDAFKEGKAYQLVLPVKGVNVLEQIVISKFMLYSYLYHHPKVRAAEQQIAEVISENLSRLSLSNGLDFLKYHDAHLFELSANGKCPEVLAILNRKLLYKSVELNIGKLSEIVKASESNIADAQDVITRLVSGKNLAFSEEFIKGFREFVNLQCKSVGKPELSKAQLIVDLPGRLKLDQFQKIFVKDEDGDFKQLVDIFPMDAWEESYYHTKWRGYIYTLPNYIDDVMTWFNSYLKRQGINVSAEALKPTHNPLARKKDYPLFTENDGGG
jgi:HD superfamily phosphohydrolase